MATDKTEEKHSNLVPWEPGQSGNPKGRPTGSRNKLSETFLADMYETWQEKGKEALGRMIEEKPGDFVRVVASLMPKDIKVSTDPWADVSDGELSAMLEWCRAAIKAAGHDTDASDDSGEQETRH